MRGICALTPQLIPRTECVLRNCLGWTGLVLEKICQLSRLYTRGLSPDLETYHVNMEDTQLSNRKMEMDGARFEIWLFSYAVLNP